MYNAQSIPVNRTYKLCSLKKEVSKRATVFRFSVRNPTKQNGETDDHINETMIWS